MKFSIRDLLWLTVVVALGVGLWVERLRMDDARKRLEQFEEFHRELKPGEYEIVPIHKPADPTTKRFLSVERKELPNSSSPAPKLPKE